MLRWLCVCCCCFLGGGREKVITQCDQLASLREPLVQSRPLWVVHRVRRRRRTCVVVREQFILHNKVRAWSHVMPYARYPKQMSSRSSTYASSSNSSCANKCCCDCRRRWGLLRLLWTRVTIREGVWACLPSSSSQSVRPVESEKERERSWRESQSPAAAAEIYWLTKKEEEEEEEEQQQQQQFPFSSSHSPSLRLVLCIYFR